MGKRGCVGESKHLIELRPLGRLEVGGQELELLGARRALAQPGEVLELEHALVEAEQRLLDRNAFELLERDLNLRNKKRKERIKLRTYGGNEVRHMGKRGCAPLETKNEKRELISDIWGKRGATYGEKGVCRRIKKSCLTNLP